MSMSPPIMRLQRMIDDQVDNFGGIGTLVAIDLPDRDRIRLVAGARSHDGAALSAADPFQIASQSKTFVALAVVLLARSGKIGLDDPVSDHVSIAIDGRVTVRHLIMNSSGIPEYMGLVNRALTDVVTPKELIEPALKNELLFTPGGRFDYSNSNWVIAALLLDAVAPGGYAGFVQNMIFTPLGMRRSFVGNAQSTDLATGSLIAADGQLSAAIEGFSLSWAYGAGDIISTCDDMLDFFRSLSRHDNPLGVTFADMTSSWIDAVPKPVHPASLGGSYSFGLERRYWGGLEVWGHPGRAPGSGASTWFAPATGVIVTTASFYPEGETPLLAAQRYNPHLLYTQAMTTAHALWDWSRQGTVDTDASLVTAG